MKETKRKPGRPKVPEDERIVTVSIKVSPEARDKFNELKKAAKLPLRVYVDRMLGVGDSN